MDFKVVFRDTFLEDLERVSSIATHNPSAASKMGEFLAVASGGTTSPVP